MNVYHINDEFWSADWPWLYIINSAFWETLYRTKRSSPPQSTMPCRVRDRPVNSIANIFILLLYIFIILNTANSVRVCHLHHYLLLCVLPESLPTPTPIHTYAHTCYNVFCFFFSPCSQYHSAQCSEYRRRPPHYHSTIILTTVIT
jgi:hypothetical protein